MKTVCAWCHPVTEKTEPGLSHGICEMHMWLMRMKIMLETDVEIEYYAKRPFHLKVRYDDLPSE